jgi:hypothetical protein
MNTCNKTRQALKQQCAPEQAECGAGGHCARQQAHNSNWIYVTLQSHFCMRSSKQRCQLRLAW